MKKTIVSIALFSAMFFVNTSVSSAGWFSFILDPACLFSCGGNFSPIPMAELVAKTDGVLTGGKLNLNSPLPGVSTSEIFKAFKGVTTVVLAPVIAPSVAVDPTAHLFGLSRTISSQNSTSATKTKAVCGTDNVRYSCLVGEVVTTTKHIFSDNSSSWNCQVGGDSTTNSPKCFATTTVAISTGTSNTHPFISDNVAQGDSTPLSPTQSTTNVSSSVVVANPLAVSKTSGKSLSCSTGQGLIGNVTMNGTLATSDTRRCADCTYISGTERKKIFDTDGVTLLNDNSVTCSSAPAYKYYWHKANDPRKNSNLLVNASNCPASEPADGSECSSPNIGNQISTDPTANPLVGFGCRYGVIKDVSYSCGGAGGWGGFSVYGTVTDKNNKPLSGVDVTIYTGGNSSFDVKVSTDSSGSYSMTGTSAHTFILFHKTGYQDTRIFLTMGQQGTVIMKNDGDTFSDTNAPTASIAWSGSTNPKDAHRLEWHSSHADIIQASASVSCTDTTKNKSYSVWAPWSSLGDSAKFDGSTNESTDGYDGCTVTGYYTATNSNTQKSAVSSATMRLDSVVTKTCANGNTPVKTDWCIGLGRGFDHVTDECLGYCGCPTGYTYELSGVNANKCMPPVQQTITGTAAILQTSSPISPASQTTPASQQSIAGQCLASGKKWALGECY